MSTASKVTIQALEYVVKTLPVGTNLALLYVLWALLSGGFLSSRGALVSGACGFGSECRPDPAQQSSRASWRLVK